MAEAPSPRPLWRGDAQATSYGHSARDIADPRPSGEGGRRPGTVLRSDERDRRLASEMTDSSCVGMLGESIRLADTSV